MHGSCWPQASRQARQRLPGRVYRSLGAEVESTPGTARLLWSPGQGGPQTPDILCSSWRLQAASGPKPLLCCVLGLECLFHPSSLRPSLANSCSPL